MENSKTFTVISALSYQRVDKRFHELLLRVCNASFWNNNYKLCHTLTSTVCQQQRNLKQKFISLLKRFRVSEDLQGLETQRGAIARNITGNFSYYHTLWFCLFFSLIAHWLCSGFKSITYILVYLNFVIFFI